MAHFAIGLVVQVKPDAKPAGLEMLGRRDSKEYVPDRPRQIEGVGDDGTFEVAGWWWNPEDLTVVGLP